MRFGFPTPQKSVYSVYMDEFTEANVPSAKDKIIMVTGANSGLGFETSRILAAAGAHVIMACRNQEKAKTAIAMIREKVEGASCEIESLDLASLVSVRDCAARVTRKHERLDVLVNNAGIMAIPRRLTQDGFEMQLGTNHLGHFALTSKLYPLLKQDAGGRVVNVSSMAHRAGKMNFDDLHGKRSYSRWGAYCQSKLANLLFTLELCRRTQGTPKGNAHAPATPVLSVAAHPGYSATNLQTVAAKMDGSKRAESFMNFGNRFFAQSAATGALPTVLAALGPAVKNGQYFGPKRLGWAGLPTLETPARQARKGTDARRLWEISERLTETPFSAN